MKKIKILLFMLAISLVTQLNAQRFTPGLDGFSSKKPAKITLNDGTEVQGVIKKLKRKKGNFVSITIEQDGEKVEYLAEKIKHMYLAPSAMQKMSSAMDFATDTDNWNKSNLNPALMKDGYAYFETTEFKKKKKTFSGIMQLVNTSSAGHFRVYHDPWAAETASFAPGGIKVAGGIDKSYYTKMGDEPAIYTSKKEYKKNGADLYVGCQEAIDAYNKEPGWKEFAIHLQTYFDNCQK
jgi:hypothetical protein